MTTEHRARSRSGAILAILGLGTALAVLLLLRRGLTPSLPSAPSAITSQDDSDPDVRPIYTASDAITRTLAHLQASPATTSATARLVSSATLSEGWYFASMNISGPDPASFLPDAPMWLVGLEASNMPLNQAIRLPGDAPLSRTDPVNGAYIVWNATSGELVSGGALVDISLNNYARLQQLANESLPIERATAYPTEAPTPSETPTP